MNSLEKQPSQCVLSNFAAPLAIASTVLLSAAIGIEAASAVTASSISPTSEEPLPATPALLLTQAFQENILDFSTPNYAVRVFRLNGRTVMNVYDRANDIVRLREAPAEFTVTNGQSAYVSTGSFSARQARYAALVTPGRQARLLIMDGSNQVIANEASTSVRTFAISDEQLQNVNRDTVLAFETASYAVRVFERGEDTFMNIYNKFTAVSEVNGQAANLVNPQPPYTNTVSYVASGTRGGQPVEYIARINSAGATTLEIYNVNGQRLFQEPGQGPVIVNIPESDLPPEVEAIGRVENAYVAAVFGDENTLIQVRQLYPTAFLDQARQGQFINAGDFQNYNAAAERVLELEALGYEARVIYRDVEYR